MLKTLGFCLGLAVLAVVLHGLWTPDIQRAELEKRYVASQPQVIEVDGPLQRFWPQRSTSFVVIAWFWFKFADLG